MIRRQRPHQARRLALLVALAGWVLATGAAQAADREVVVLPATGIVGPSSTTREQVDVARLEEVEERLLNRALELHPRADGAINRLCDDSTALAAAMEHSRRAPLLLRSTATLNRMEEMMLEAVVRTHPNRDRALDRLLADVADDVPPAAWLPAALGEHFVDNDFDGMA